MWETAYEGATPTKLPAGALFLTLPGGRAIRSFELDEATAEGIVHLDNGTEARMFFSATEPVATARPRTTTWMCSSRPSPPATGSTSTGTRPV